MSLEQILKKAQNITNWYGNSIKQNYKQFIPSLVASTVCAYAGQDFADFIIENPSEWMVQMTGYLSASVGGYSSFLTLEYKNNNDKYPNGFISKEMCKTLLDITSADYIADLISFTPVFVALNHYLLNKGIDTGISGGVSSGVGTVTYFFTMCAVYDRLQLVTQKINNGFKEVKNSINSLINNDKNII